MITTIIIIKNVLYLLVFTLLFSYTANGEEINDPSREYDSIYIYNSLENKASFQDLAMINNVDTIVEPSQVDKLPDDISQKLQELTLKQDFSKQKINNAINIIKERSGLRTFLTGNSLGILRYQMVQIKDYISALNNLKLKTEDHTIKMKIDNQIQSLQQEERKIESIINEQENKFNLFGWFVAIL